MYNLTNEEASTVLCSVVKHAGSGYSTKEVYGETRDVVECLSLLLERSNRFLECSSRFRDKFSAVY